ncbi:MAG: molecular chaperone GrpE [Saprospiraceae bacterium]|jgi:molecular chaperone GrpE
MFKKIKDIMSKKDNNADQHTEADQDVTSTVEDQNAENQEETTENEHQEPKKRSKKQLQQDKVKQELEEKDNQIAELKDKYLRLLAEFDNYKKRSVKEKVEFMKSAAQDTMAVLLPVLDDFDRAKKNAEDENSTEPFSEGVALVYNKLHNSLKQKGLEPMVSNGEVFDPELHEAITEIPAPTEDLKGKIIDTVETGYFLKDKIIRHAKVVVGK